MYGEILSQNIHYLLFNQGSTEEAGNFVSSVLLPFLFFLFLGKLVIALQILENEQWIQNLYLEFRAS